MRIVTASLLALVMAVSSAAFAEPAVAALPRCNDWTTIRVDLYDYMLPSAGANGSGAIACSLSLGDVTNGVFVLQAALNRCHNAGLATDRIYGPLTRNAILWAQAANGFPQNERNGVYAPKTRDVLKWPYYLWPTGDFAGCWHPSFS